MLQKLRLFIFFGLCFIAIAACTTGEDKPSLHYLVVDDSLFINPYNYDSAIRPMKELYEECMQYPLFENAFYMGLQENVNIGSISNKDATNVNKQFSIFDSSNRGNILNLFAIIKNANCDNKLTLTKDLQRNFYKELSKNLEIGQYQFLTGYIDSTRINFKITNLADNSIRPDSLASLLQRTQDTSLLQYKKLLMTPGNALLVRTAMILGFYGEFPLTKNLPPDEAKKLKNEVFFKIGDYGEQGSIKSMPNGNIQVFIQKYYTVFGQFYDFSKTK